MKKFAHGVTEKKVVDNDMYASYDIIMNLMNHSAQTNSYSYTLDKIYRTINYLINDKNKYPPSDFIKKFINYVKPIDSSYTSRQINYLYSRDSKKIENIIDLVLLFITPDADTQMQLFRLPSNLSHFTILLDRNIKLSLEVLVQLVQKSYDKGVISNIVKKLSESEINDIINRLSHTPSIKKSSVIRSILLSKDIKISISISNEVFESLFLIHNFKDDHICYEYYSKGYEINSNCIANSLVDKSLKSTQLILESKILPTSLEPLLHNIKRYSLSLDKILNMLQFYGYNIKKRDIIDMIKINKHLNLENNNLFKKYFDTECLHEVYRNISDIYGQNWTDFAEPDEESLEILCSRESSTTIINEIKKVIEKGIIPTVKCLNIAVSSTSDSGIIDTLMEYGVEPDKSTYEIIKTKYHSKILIKYVDSVLGELDTYKKRFGTIKVNKQKVKNTDKKEKNTDKSVENNEDDEFLDCSDCSDIDIVSIDTKVSGPENKRKKINPPEKVVKIFSIDKTKNISYIDVRKMFMDTIKDNSLINKKDKKVFSLPYRIRRILNLPKSGEFRFSDLDKIINMCYS